MRRWDLHFVAALCLSLALHVGIWAAGKKVPLTSVQPVKREGSFVINLKNLKIRHDPNDPEFDLHDDMGEANGTGTGANATEGDTPQQAQQGDQDQALLSRDPVGAGRVGDLPSPWTGPAGEAGRGGQAGRAPAALPQPPTPPARPPSLAQAEATPAPPAVRPDSSQASAAAPAPARAVVPPETLVTLPDPPSKPPAPKGVSTPEKTPPSNVEPTRDLPRVPTQPQQSPPPPAAFALTDDPAPPPTHTPVTTTRPAYAFAPPPPPRGIETSKLAHSTAPDEDWSREAKETAAKVLASAVPPPSASPELPKPSASPPAAPVPPAPAPSPPSVKAPPDAPVRAATGDGLAPGRAAADPAPQSDSESDAFAKVGSAVYHNGKLDARRGRKVKTTRPRIEISGLYDTLGLRDPTVTLKISIDATGKVTSADIVRSSGSNDLDQPCLVAVYDWWFEPARDRKGDPVPDVVLFSITFR